jgi:hypothetical protein
MGVVERAGGGGLRREVKLAFDITCPYFVEPGAGASAEWNPHFPRYQSSEGPLSHKTLTRNGRRVRTQLAGRDLFRIICCLSLCTFARVLEK